MKLDHAWAADFLDRYARFRSEWDGDAFAALHAPDVVVQQDPFEPPLIGLNAVRADLLAASEYEEQVQLVFERHWVVPPTILAAWHASYVHRTTRGRVRLAGFVSFEIVEPGVIQHARFWYNRQERTAE